MRELPKILIIGSDFDPHKGTGITTSNLFFLYPKGKLIIANSQISEYDREKCSAHYTFEKKDIKYNAQYNWILNILKKVKCYAYVKNTFMSINRRRLITKNPFENKDFDAFIEWINKENPDVIYSMVVNDISKIPFLINLRNKSKVPLVLHIVDDWISQNYFGLFKFYFGKTLNQEFEHLLSVSAFNLCISESMAEEYHKRYNHVFQVIHNPINENAIAKYDKINISVKPFQIIYTGTIEEYNLCELLFMNNVLSKIHDENNLDCKLHIYGTLRKVSYLNIINDCRYIKHHGFVEPNKLNEIINKHHLLFLPMSFNPKMIKSIKLSMPTKISEYMVCTPPILLFAPRGLAVTEYAINDKWAFVVEVKNANVLRDAILKLLSDNKLRISVSERANEIAKREHYLSILQNRFNEVLIKASKLA